VQFASVALFFSWQAGLLLLLGMDGAGQFEASAPGGLVWGDFGLRNGLGSKMGQGLLGKRLIVFVVALWGGGAG